MGFVNATDVRKLLQDPELKAEIAKAAAADPDVLDDLAEDIADEMEDELEDDPEFKAQIIDRHEEPGVQEKADAGASRRPGLTPHLRRDDVLPRGS